MSEYFPETKSLGERMKIELDLSNFATKEDLKNTKDVDASKFARKFNLTHLKSNVDKLDVENWKMYQLI